MRCLYRETKYFCGDFLEVDIYPIFRPSLKKRKAKAKPTEEAQKKLNDHNAEKKLIRLVNANFTEDDIRLDLTYADAFVPDSDEGACRDLRNYLRRLKRLCKKLGIQLKYIATTERGKRKGRYHHHILLPGGIPTRELARLWGKGYPTVKPLVFNEVGLAGIAVYLMKDSIYGKRWIASQNLIRPVPKQRDGRISATMAALLARDSEDRKIFEDLYPGWKYAEVRPIYNEINSHTYLCIRMYRDKSAKNGSKRTKAAKTRNNRKMPARE